MNDGGASSRAPAALVTGASGGIGAALARWLARRGLVVWLAARRMEALREVQRDIVAAGGQAHAVELDVTDCDATAARVLEWDAAVQGFDLVVANAGIGETDLAATLRWDLTRDTLRTNVLGAAATLAPLVPRMIARRRGHLVGISSLAADFAGPGGAAYAASKAFLTHFLNSLRAELRVAGVACTVVHPGFIRTAMTAGNRFPMPFLLDVDAAADRIDQAIARRVEICRFPRRMWWLMRAFGFVPATLREALVLRGLRRSADGTGVPR